MKKIIMLLAVLAVFAATVVFLMVRSSPANGIFSVSAPPDAVSGFGVHGGASSTVANKAGGFQFDLPVGWYLERNTSSDVAIYAGYSPVAPSTTSTASAAACKIEISFYPAEGDVNLDDWIDVHLRKDPTIEISEDIREPVAVGGETGVLWRGTLNGITAELVFVSANGRIYEIAPSPVAGTTDGATVCDAALRSILPNFDFNRI